MKKTIVIGKVNSSKVVLEVELRKKKVTEGLNITTDWVQLKPGSEYIELSIMGNCRTRGCGQIRDIIDEMTSFELPEEKVRLLFEIWNICHLNGMNAASIEQQPIIDLWKSNPIYKKDNYHDRISHILKQHSCNPDSHNYIYGSRWLIQRLPDEVIEFIQYLPNDCPSDFRSELLEWIQLNDIKWKVSSTQMNPNMPESKGMDHWKYEFDCAGEPLTIYFSTGYGHRIGPRDNGHYNSPNSFKLNQWKEKMWRQLVPDWREYGIQKDRMNKGKFERITGMTYWIDTIEKSIAIPTPPDEVLAVCLMDTYYIENYADHFEFGNEMGWDMADRKQHAKALTCWNNLIELNRDMNRVFGGNLYKIRELADGLI